MKPRQITIALLRQAMEIEKATNQLNAAGVQLICLEQLQIDILLLLMRLHGIKKDDEAMDWVLAPVFSWLLGEIEFNSCIKQLYERLAQLRQERRGVIETVKDPVDNGP